ncbi:hypothetical protein ACTG2S_01930 [Aeromonas sp. 82P]|uniref:hypothetical protein n=1 Tax=Aeromonas TaxID=642 RepID=UPI000A86B27C|nr:hypothetical protein [Aeromonas veronii]MDD1846045.1 hypothetical protein [Aeromonas veronii]
MSQASTSTLYLLSNFSSLFEVAVGLNLVFSMWDSLRNQAVERLKKISDELEKNLELNLGVNYKDSRCAQKFAEKKNEQLQRLEKLSQIAKIVGLLITSAIMLLLSCLGYLPEIAFSFWQIALAIVLSTLTSPSFLLWGNIQAKRSRAILEEHQKQQETTFLDIQEFTTGK